MIAVAISRTLDQTEYTEHAWVMEQKFNLVNGLPVDREYVVGDMILTSGPRVRVTDVFEAFDFHTRKPLRVFKTVNVCGNCLQTYTDSMDLKLKHEGRCEKPEDAPVGNPVKKLERALQYLQQRVGSTSNPYEVDSLIDAATLVNDARKTFATFARM
jgi:hypothetical protein